MKNTWKTVDLQGYNSPQKMWYWFRFYTFHFGWKVGVNKWWKNSVMFYFR